MDDRFRKTMEDLKLLLLDTYRSASLLDNLIQNIESEDHWSKGDTEYLARVIQTHTDWYKKLKQQKGYDKLNEKEQLIFDELLQVLKEETL